MARFAVSAVTCRQAEMRMPFSGWFLMNSLRMICRTFMDWLAQSMRFLPKSAKSKFLMSDDTCVGVVAMLLPVALNFYSLVDLCQEYRENHSPFARAGSDPLSF